MFVAVTEQAGIDESSAGSGAAEGAANPELDKDIELFEHARGRDEAATRRFYRAHVDVVHRHVCRVLGAQDPDIDDVVQQTFLAALGEGTRFERRSSLRTWLCGIAARKALDAARSRWRRRRFSFLLEPIGLGEAPRSPDTGDEASWTEQVLATLAPELRLVFVLVELEERTLNEVSVMTGVGISTLHARLNRAKERLAATVQQMPRPHGEHA